MNNFVTNTRKPFHEKIVLIFSLLMAIVYVLVGSGIMFWPFPVEILSEGLRTPFGIALIIYGIFRIYRVYRQYSQ
jgi:uncharacterized membrane protein